jgi:DNA-binding NarL/FixJ family response regulator
MPLRHIDFNLRNSQLGSWQSDVSGRMSQMADEPRHGASMARPILSDDNQPVEIHVVIVGDEALVRAGLAQLLGQSGDIVVAGEASDTATALAAVAELRPDLVLMDLSRPRVDGTTATRRIHQAHPDIRVLVLSSYAARDDVLDALNAGAVGYLLKDAQPEDLFHAIRSAVSGGSPLAPRAARELVTAWRERREPDALTARDLDVLLLLAEGLPNKVIAQRLGIAEKTVKSHVTKVFQALHVTDRTQAALWVERHGLSPRQQERREQLMAPTRSDAA